MSTPEPVDLMIILRIVEYLHERARGRVPQASDGQLRTYNITSGAGLEVNIVDGRGKQEVVVGDQYNVSGQAGAVGSKASSHNLTLNQIAQSGIHPAGLALELEALHHAMRSKARTPSEREAAMDVERALAAARQGNHEIANAHLSRTGKWALEVATTIGTAVAAEAIKFSLGL